MTAPTVRAVPPPFRLHGLGRIRPVLSVTWVFALMAVLTIGYYVAVLNGVGNLSYITVGIAFLLGTDGLLLAFSTGRRPPASSTGPIVLQRTCRSSSPATTAPT
jgi:hypothetical protein